MTGTAEDESVTVVSEKVVMQDMEETGPGTAKTGIETVETELKWQV